MRGTALDIAERIWSDRRRFVKRLTSMEDAIQKHQNGCIWSDAGDNPGAAAPGRRPRC